MLGVGVKRRELTHDQYPAERARAIEKNGEVKVSERHWC